MRSFPESTSGFPCHGHLSLVRASIRVPASYMYARSREFRDVCTRKRVASDSPIGTARQSPPANIACCSNVVKELDSPSSSKYAFSTEVFVSIRFLKQLKLSTRLHKAFLWTGSFPAFYAFCPSWVTEVHLVICYFLYHSEDGTCNLKM